jgi:hypothetical protein
MLLAASGVDLPLQPRYYVPFADVAGDLAAKAQPIDALVARKPEAAAAIDKAVARSGVPRERLAWVPVHGRLEFGVALVDVARREVVVVVPVHPY